MKTKNCPKCNKVIAASVKMCPKCGFDTDKTPKPAKTKKQKITTAVVSIIICVLVIIAIVLVVKKPWVKTANQLVAAAYNPADALTEVDGEYRSLFWENSTFDYKYAFTPTEENKGVVSYTYNYYGVSMEYKGDYAIKNGILTISFDDEKMPEESYYFYDGYLVNTKQFMDAEVPDENTFDLVAKTASESFEFKTDGTCVCGDTTYDYVREGDIITLTSGDKNFKMLICNGYLTVAFLGK